MARVAQEKVKLYRQPADLPLFCWRCFRGHFIFLKELTSGHVLVAGRGKP